MFNRFCAFLLAARVGTKAVSLHHQTTCFHHFRISRQHRWQNSRKARLGCQVPYEGETVKSSSSPSIPSWDLSLVLRALQDALFEPLQSANLKLLSMKTLLLVALASIKRLGDRQAFSVEESCLEFGPGDNHAVLRTWPGYVPKVHTTPFRDQVVNLQAQSLSDQLSVCYCSKIHY